MFQLRKEKKNLETKKYKSNFYIFFKIFYGYIFSREGGRKKKMPQRKPCPGPAPGKPCHKLALGKSGKTKTKHPSGMCKYCRGEVPLPNLKKPSQQPKGDE